MNLNNFLYLLIGQRIKNDMDKKGLKLKNYSIQLNQKYFKYVDESRLSKIQNGKKISGAYISQEDYEMFCDYANRSQFEMIFGDEEERIDLIKYILLLIIINGEKDNEINVNPFVSTKEVKIQNKKTNPAELTRLVSTFEDYKNKDLFELRYKIGLKIPHNNKQIRLSKKEYNHYYNNLLNIDSFFINQRNYELFSKYNYDFNDKIEKASNLLVRILLGDIQLSKYFRSAIGINNVKDFIAFKGQYGNLLLDSKSGKYVLFINAFNTMFKIYKKEFLNYFNKMLFSNFMNKKNLMDILSTIDINEMININTFVELLENIYYRDIYECTRMVGHNIITHHLQIENNNLLYDEKKYGHKEYLIDLSQISDFKAIYEIEDIYLEQTKLIINRYTEISNL